MPPPDTVQGYVISFTRQNKLDRLTCRVHLGEQTDRAFLSADYFAHFSTHVSQLGKHLTLAGENLAQLSILLSFVLFFLILVVLIRVLSTITAKYFIINPLRDKNWLSNLIFPRWFQYFIHFQAKLFALFDCFV